MELSWGISLGCFSFVDFQKCVWGWRRFWVSGVYDHPLYYLLHDEPNPEITSFVFRETLMSPLLIWGNTYAQIIRDGGCRVLGAGK